MSDLRSRALSYLRGPCIISEPGDTFRRLIHRYVAGEPWDTPEWQNLLLQSVQNAHAEAVRREGAEGAEGPERDALGFYRNSAELLEAIQAEVGRPLGGDRPLELRTKRKTSDHKRRWFRFSLATLFVVLTVFGVWLGWQVNIVRERSEMRSWLESRHGELIPPGKSAEVTIPLWRRWLGDEPVAFINGPWPPAYSDEEYERLLKAFPEASLWPVDKPVDKAP